MTSATPTSKIALLNAQRRRAVQLRIDGRPLAVIQRETGLSLPTIVGAFRAFKAGGWTAVDVGERGRPKGSGRTIDLAREARMQAAALAGPPEAAGLPAHPLWSPKAVAELAATRHQVTLSARAVLRTLHRWGLGVMDLAQAAGASRAAAAEAVWQAAQAEARQANARLYWAGLVRLPASPDGGVRHALVAVSPRGTVHWLPAPAVPRLTDYQDFLQRLQRRAEGRCDVLLHGPDLLRPSPLRDWLATQPLLQVRPAPAAPRPRPGAEPLATLPPLFEPASAPVPPPARVTPETPSLARAAAVTVPDRSPQEEPAMTNLTHLQRLEAESIHIMREVVAEADKPVMLYSIGKDSAVMLHLARKAFYPAPPPFPLLHVDTTWKFRAMYEMRARMAEEMGMELLVYQNPEAKELGINPFDHGSQIHTDMWKTQGLKQALDKYGFDVAFGGARRDEEKSRAKERVMSFRTAQHRWDPKNQRPELWHLYNGRKMKGESIRCFPISNWTELDIWQYIYLENIPIVPLYFAAERPVVERDGTLIMVDDERMRLKPGEVPMMKSVRFRTLGCYPLSGAVESDADSLTAIIQEMLLTRTSERQGRMIDHDTAASMEKKKQEGYF